MKTAYAYARFSSSNQQETSIDAQLRAIRDYCAREGVTIIQEFVDEAKSATSDNRPGFRAMFQALDSRTVDYVIVHKLDRFSRDRYDSAYYRRIIRKAGARLVSVLEPLDDSPESVILESMLEGMAEYYSKNLARETMKGLRERALQCKHTGGAPLYGYKVNADKTYRIDPLEAAVVKEVFRRYADGERYEDIAAAVAGRKKLGKSAINSMLSNEKYHGVYIFGRQTRAAHNSRAIKPDSEIVRIPGGVPQIIDDDTWARAQERLHDTKRRAAAKVNHFYLLQGKVVCGVCGSVMGVFTSSRAGYEYGYYRCPKRCGMPSCRSDKLDEAILESFSRSIKIDEPTIQRFLRAMPPEDDTDRIVAEELKKTRREIKGLVEAIKAGAHHQMVLNELEQLTKKEQELQARPKQTRPGREAVIAFLERMKGIQFLPPEEQKRVIRPLIDHIKITTDGRVTVSFVVSHGCGGRT